MSKLLLDEHPLVILPELAVEIDPSYKEAYYELGRALVVKGKISDAISKFKQALVLSKDFYIVLNKKDKNETNIIYSNDSIFDVNYCLCKNV